MAKDAGLFQIKQARGLKLNSTSVDRVGGLNKEDIYQFKLSGTNNLSIQLRSSNASLQLVKDQNQNNKIESNEIIARLRSRNTPASITIPRLPSGTFYLRVLTSEGKPTQYRLTTSTQPVTEAGSSNPANTPSPTPSALSPSPTPSALSPSPTPSPSPTQSFIDRVIALTNAFRQQNGLQPLTVNSKLNTAAQVHSQHMATEDFFSHTEPDGSQPWDRMTAAGYSWSQSGENIAAGQTTPEEVVNDWINSPGHRANMLSPKFREIGVGYYELANDTGNVNYHYYWTQVFGSPL
jgi:uncharacterized protein YkwD